MRLQKLMTATAAGIALTLGLAACSSSDEPDTTVTSPGGDETAPPNGEETLSAVWQEKFDAALASDELTDVERAAIEDYWVSDDEWEAAADLFHDCAADVVREGVIAPSGEGYFAGLSAADKEYIRELSANPDPDFSFDMLMMRDCALESVANIGVLYSGPRINPEGTDRHSELRECLRENGHDDYADLPDDEIDHFYLAGHMRFDRGSYECVEAAAEVS